MLRTALTLARKNLAVFPCLPRDKKPATSHGCNDATTDADTIRQWWRDNPQFNIGVATGAASGIFVVDVDGLDTELEVRRLEAEHGKLPATVEAITGKGRHLYFRMPEMPLRKSASKIAPGIDIRATGGYVIAPPSIHPSGRAYRWSDDSASAFAAAPDWLLDKISEPSNGKLPAQPSAWRALVADGVGEGQRDNAATRLCGYLLRHYVDPLVTLEMLQLWNAARCRPPLPCEDIERIVDSIAGKEIRRRYGHAG